MIFGKTFSFILSVLVGAMVFVGCFCSEVPKRQKLTACTTNNLQFSLICSNWPPYQIVLGTVSTNAVPTFRGTVIVQRGTYTLARIPISSSEVTPCNWLHLEGLAGYILTSQPTNGTDLDKILVRGQRYNLRVIFDDLPSAESSLWLSSIGKADW